MTNLIRQSAYRTAKSVHGREYAKKLPPVESDAYLAWRLENDPEFFQKKLLKIVTKGKLQPLEPRYHQRILINIYRALKIAQVPARMLFLKARRLGMSTEIEALGAQEATTRPFRRVKVVAHDRESAEYIFNMARVFYDEMHEEVKPMKRYSSKQELVFENPDDKTRASNPGLRSQITIATAGGTQVGRGQEVDFLHLSEAAFYDNAGDLSAGLLQTVDYRHDTSIFIESTANGTGNWFHDQYWGHKEGKEQLIQDLIRDFEDVDKLVSHLESFEGTVGYLPLFFPWHEFADYQLSITSDAERAHIKESIDEDEQELITLYGLSLEQLKWRRAKIDELARTAEGIPPLELFKQEYPASDREAFLSTGRGVFESCLKQLQAMDTHAPLMRARLTPASSPRFKRGAPYKVPLLKHPFGELSIYRPPKPGHHYAIGGDTAFADKGRDYSCLEVLDKESLEQVAEWHGKIDPDILGQFAFQLGCFYNNATIAIERNNMGIGSLISLRDTNYPNIYVMRQYAKVEGENPLDSLGWETTSSSKPKCIVDMIEHIRLGKMKFNSEALISECLSYKTDERGRMGAEEGKHDDRVMAMAIALQAVIDYPPKKEIPTLGQIMKNETLKEAMVTTAPAADAQFGDIFP